MSPLIKQIRKIPDEWEKPDELCDVCGDKLTPPKSKGKEAGLWWCPSCDDWRFPIGMDFNKMPTWKIRGRMDLYMTKARQEIAKQVKTYESGKFSQEFLKSLIPKR